MSGPPLLVWGAGAIGGTVGAYLRRTGEPVMFVDRDAAHVDAIATHGIEITGPIAAFKVAAEARAPSDLTGTFDTVLLCVKAQDTAAAAEVLAPFLAADGC